MQRYPLTPVWLFSRALLRHLLLILLYAGLLGEPLMAQGLSGWGVFALLATLFGTVGLAVMWRHHYPPRKLLWVHGIGGLAGLLAVNLHPIAVAVALLLTLLLMTLPYRDGIRLNLPPQRAER